jgi:hypothetical protein
MATKKKSAPEIVTEMTQMIAGHLETMPSDERKKRLKAFEDAVNGGEKRANVRSKVRRVSGSRRSSRRIPA